jgi:hypothetical protein
MNDFICPYCGAEAATLEGIAAHKPICPQNPLVTGVALGSPLVVGPEGSDASGTGTWANPYKTLSKALTMVTVNRTTIFMLPGQYVEPAIISWPNISGISVIGLGSVSISNGNAAAAVIDINPLYTASTFSVTLKDINIAAADQIGVQINNAHMSKKLNIYLDRVSTEMDTPDQGADSDSISMANAVTTQAIRIYARDCSFEGLVHITTANAGGRYRFRNCDFLAGVTTAGAVAAEFTFLACISNAAITRGSETANFANKGCLLGTDADPAIYSDWADVVATN